MELASLKSQSDESFAFAAQARSSLPDISDLRVAIKDSSECPYKFSAVEDLRLTPSRLSPHHRRPFQINGDENAYS
jgi:hypothetical protein